MPQIDTTPRSDPLDLSVDYDYLERRLLASLGLSEEQMYGASFLERICQEGALEEALASYWGYTERVFPDEPVEDLWAEFLGKLV